MARKIILGTDWWTDCDDCVAVRLLCSAHKAGDIELLGIGLNACMEYSAASLNAFLTAEGLADIPIGIDLDGTDFRGTNLMYQKPLAENYPHAISRNEDVENSVDMYIRLLEEANEPVDIIEIGFCQVLAGVLEKAPELFAKKVRRLYVMAGRWDMQDGSEHNFNNNPRSRMGGHILCEKCPSPITFLGYEVGNTVLSGDSLPDNHILTFCLTHYGCIETGRWSWDPMTVLLALADTPADAGYKTVKGRAYVSPETGKNRFTEDASGPHEYVVKMCDDTYYREEIQKRL